ncbi:MAG: hypothetical protein ACNYWU_13415 [Desulfobacterales bacterium]
MSDLVNYQCVEDCFEIFEQVYEDRFERRHTGFNVYCGPRILHGNKSPWIIWLDTSSALVLPGKDDLPSGSWASGVAIKGRYSDKGDIWSHFLYVEDLA